MRSLLSTALLSTALLSTALVLSVAHAQRLVDFQVSVPPPLPTDAQQCTVRVLERTFGNSFGDPEIVQYTPPTDCGAAGTWAGISLNLTVTSNGTQFDRLGIFTFQNVEIWRTSTPEPTSGDGIIWQYLKDVTKFQPLFAKPGTFIFQLDNLLETGLNGQYATTLDATFFASSAAHPPAPQADLVIPITTLANNTGNDASVPPDFSLNVTLPTNAVAAFVEMQASGNGNEEFWYFNAPNDFIGLLPSGTTFGDGPFREVRFLVDGMIAGAAFPYPVVFTGGIVPPAWRPITSYGAIDLPQYHFDLTPFIPILTDGNQHTITLDVVSAETDHAINQNWFVSGLVQVLLDSSSEPTTGNITVYDADLFAHTTESGNQSANRDVIFTVGATRSIHIESEIIGGSGTKTSVVFDQKLSFSNTQMYLDNTAIQIVNQTASGTISSKHNGQEALRDNFQFPFFVNFTITNPSGSAFEANFDHSYNRDLLPAPFILGTKITEHQLAGGAFLETANGNIGANGTSENTLVYVDTQGNTFTQTVNAASNVIVLNDQGGNLASSPLPASEVAHGPLTQPTPTPVDTSIVARLPGGRILQG